MIISTQNQSRITNQSVSHFNLIYPKQPIAKEPTIQSEINSSRSPIIFDIMHNFTQRQLPKSVSNDDIKYVGSLSNLSLKKYQSKQISLIDINLQEVPERITNTKCILYLIWSKIYTMTILLLFTYHPISLSFEQLNLTDALLILKSIDMAFQIIQRFTLNIICRKSNYQFQIQLVFDFVCTLNFLMNSLMNISVENQLLMFMIVIAIEYRKFHSIWEKYQQYLCYINFLYAILVFNYLICLWNQFISSDEETAISENYVYCLIQVFKLLTFSSVYEPVTIQQCYSYFYLLLLALISQIYCVFSIYYFYQYAKLTKKDDNYTQEIFRRYFKNYYFQSFDYEYCTEIINNQKGDMILKRGEIDDSSLYFILDGQYHLITDTGISIHNIQRVFGEIGFYTQQLRTGSVICKENGKLIKVDRNKFLMQLSQHDKELFFNQVNNINFKSVLPYKCLNCNLKTHYLNKCPQLTYQPDVEILINQNNQKSIRKIYPYRRKRNKKSNSYQIYKESQRRQFCFQMLYQDNKSFSSNSIPTLPYEEVQSLNLSSNQYETNNYNRQQFEEDQFHFLTSKLENDSYFSDQEKSYNEKVLNTPNFKQKIHQAVSSPKNEKDQPIRNKATSIQTKRKSSSFRHRVSSRLNLPLITESYQSMSKIDSSPFLRLDHSQIKLNSNFDIDGFYEFQHFQPNANKNKIIEQFEQYNGDNHQI